ncbi:hypothetical protein [Streptomyces sp. NPDC058401]|uniref:hypothetical protein n=1 Tax=Streptomyces sp. NPDC058401 TaxID=3346480 RepID=UPI0036559EDB
MRGLTPTSWPGLAADVGNSGGTSVDEPLRVCEAATSALVTSREPGNHDASVLRSSSSSGAP